MAEDVKPDIIKGTQDVLGKFIKKPILTEKLLKKPPFRFLHDICTSVMKETGFLSGVITGPEDMIENIKDKEGKIAFLQKVIATVEAANGIKLSVKPTKIVAGLEPTKTNELLQELGKALKKQMTESKNSKSVISKTKSTRNHSKEVKQEQSDKKETPKAIFENGVHEKNGVAENKNTNENVKNRITRNSQQTKKKKESNTKQEDKKGIEKKTKEKPLVYENEHEEMNVKHKEHDASKDKVSFIEGGDSAALSKIDDIKVNGMKDQSDQNVMESQLLQEIPTRKPTGKHKHREPSVFSSTSERKLNANSEIENLEAQNKDNESKPEKINFCNKYEEGPQEQDQTPSLSGQPNYIKKDPNIVREKTGLMSRPRTGIRPTTARPASARPAAPRIKERGDVISAEESTMPTPIKINVIVDRDLHNETEDDNLISLETENDILLDEISTAPLPVVSQPNGHGHLVEQILEVKRELEDDRRLPSSEEKNNEKGNIEWESRRNAETEIREIEKLRSLIQLLTRSTNPLGKLLDFFQEDVDSMQRELEVWKNKNSSLCIQIAHEKSITEQFVEPLKIHLKEIQQSIDEQSDQISHVKANIIKNNQKIRKLLFGV